MVAHTILIGSVEEDIPIGGPARVAAEVTAVREVLDGLTALSADDTYVGVGATTAGDVGEGDPLPVGRPYEVGVKRLLAVGDLTSLAGLEVVDHELLTLVEEGYLIAIGGEGGIHLLSFERGDELLVADSHSVGEVLIFATLDLSDVEIP